MSAVKRRKKVHHEEHENHERWLVSGYDMMTLLFAVFVVLFAISSTNVSKVKELRQSLQESFSGPVLTGGKAMVERGNASDVSDAPPEPPIPSLTPVEAMQQGFAAAKATESEVEDAAAAAAELAAEEEEDFQALKRRIDKAVREAGLAHKVSTTVSKRGLKVRLLTDKLFFDSGSAVVNAAAYPTLGKIGGILAQEHEHPVQVEGHTDDRPIRTTQFPSNWQLSGARAGAVVQQLVRAGVGTKRVSLAGYAAERPATTNGTPRGRALNRRVEIILTRMHGATLSHGGDP